MHYIYENVIIAAVRFVTDRITPVKYSHIFIVKKGRVLVSQTVQTENKMGIMPIPKLLISMSLPMMISMLVQALYNIVDSMFVAKLCEEALTAVSLAFPIQTLMISVASGTGSRYQCIAVAEPGEKNFKGAQPRCPQRYLSRHHKLYRIRCDRHYLFACILLSADQRPADRQIR